MSLRRDYSLSTSSPSTPIRNTSTPFPTRRKSILSPKPNSIFSRRYSLSDVDCITPIEKNSRFLSPKNGPNSVKSPVNARQSPENKELLINHQKMRYNRPGVFPIVHLNKQNLPILKEKPKNVTVRLASPELFRQNSAEHNRLLLEKVVQNSPKRALSATTTAVTTTPTSEPVMTTNRNIEISTRSVLDALKEISRKRIHTNEEIEYLKDDGKRIRLDRINDDLLLNKKRQRGESPPYENCQNSNMKLIKRQCSLSEVLASQSSMEIKSSTPESSLSVSSSESKQKNKVVAEVEIHIPSKKPCLVNAETQTQIAEQKSNLKEVGVQSKESMPPLMHKKNVEKSTVETSSSTPTTTTVKSPACLKVFDEAPLERTRKDRLSVLMGIKRKSADLNTNQEDKPIMSILSNSINKHLKSNTPKHVTFNLESESTNDTMQEQQQQQTIEKTVNLAASNSVSITQTTASITTPLISSVVSETTKSPNKGVVQTNEAKMISKETVSFNQAKTTENTVVPTFNFIATKPESSTSNPVVTAISTISTNNLFKSPNNSGNAPTTTSSPPKIGGFKFDLKPTATNNSNFSLPPTTATTQATIKENPKPAFFFAGGSNSAGLNQTITTTTKSNSANVAPQFSLSSAAPKFNFTSTVATTTTTPTTITTSLGFTQSNSRSFGSTGGFSLNFTPQTTQSFVNPNPVATTPSFVNPNPVATTPSFVNPNPVATTPSFVNPNPVATTPSFVNPNPVAATPSFANPNPVAATPSFANPNPVATTTARLSHTFKIQSPQYNLFGNLNPAVTTTTISGTSTTFGIPSTTSNVFGTNPVPPTFGSAGFNFVGGNSATNAQIEKPSFGNIPVTQQNSFTTTTTTTPPATTTTSIFNTNVFNTAKTTNPATSQINPPAFGATNNSTNVFGNSNAFNTPPSQQQQQQQSTTVRQPQQNPPTFGNVFDTNKPPAFGDNSAAFSTTFGSTSFGTTNQNQSIFGGNSNNNNSGGFPTNPPPASSPPQGGVFSFGGNPNKAGGVFSFGQNEPPKPTFNFATNTGNTGGFNNSFTAATATNNNGTVGGAPQFNPPVAGAMFNIGAGGAVSTPRARTQLKAKRRT